MSCTSLFGSGSPARLTTLTLEGTPSTLIKAVMADGTVLISVTCSRAGSVGKATAFSAKMIVPPQDKGTKISNTERSKQIEVEASVPANSRGEKTDRAHSSNTTTLRCSIATPFGRPVDPDV